MDSFSSPPSESNMFLNFCRGRRCYNFILRENTNRGPTAKTSVLVRISYSPIPPIPI